MCYTSCVSVWGRTRALRDSREPGCQTQTPIQGLHEHSTWSSWGLCTGPQLLTVRLLCLLFSLVLLLSLPDQMWQLKCTLVRWNRPNTLVCHGYWHKSSSKSQECNTVAMLWWDIYFNTYRLKKKFPTYKWQISNYPLHMNETARPFKTASLSHPV